MIEDISGIYMSNPTIITLLKPNVERNSEEAFVASSFGNIDDADNDARIGYWTWIEAKMWKIQPTGSDFDFTGEEYKGGSGPFDIEFSTCPPHWDDHKVFILRNKHIKKGITKFKFSDFVLVDE